MSIDLDRYPSEMRRLQRAGSALLVPGVVLAAFGGFWLILVGMVFAFHEEMQADAGEDYWLILGVLIVLGVVPSLVAAVLIRLGWARRRLRSRLRDLAALARVHGVAGDATVEQQLGLTPDERARLLEEAVARGLLPAAGASAASTPETPPPGSLFNDTYAVEEILRQGEQGAVYRVRHVRTDQIYALETFVPGPHRPADVLDRSLRASVAASDLDHPGLVRVIDLDATAAGMPFVVTEWLEGELDPPHAAHDERVAGALEALRGAGLELLGTSSARVFMAREPGEGERPVLLHVGYLRH